MDTSNQSLTHLLHNITQSGYRVSFNSDFEGMMRVEFTKEWDDQFYEHVHSGFPGALPGSLTRSIMDTLIWFKTKYLTENDHE